MEPEWINDYIGIPFKSHGKTKEGGVDCWQLIRMIYGEQFGIELPDYAEYYDHAKNFKQVGSILGFEEKRLVAEHQWIEIQPGEEHLGDVIILNRITSNAAMKYVPCHVAMVINAKSKKMIHVYEGIDTVRERYAGLRWGGNQIRGFYRHIQLDGV